MAGGDDEAMKLVVFGLGFTSEAFLRFAEGQFTSVVATVRTAEKASRTTKPGCEVVVLNEANADPRIAQALSEADAVLVSVGPDEAGDPVLRRFAQEIETSKSIRWIGYLSTIGVYGDADGGWVDESVAPNPSHARTQRRVEVEQAWLALGQRSGKATQIFRLAGIYGPGRNPIINLDQRAQRVSDLSGRGWGVGAVATLGRNIISTVIASECEATQLMAQEKAGLLRRCASRNDGKYHAANHSPQQRFHLVA